MRLTGLQRWIGKGIETARYRWRSRDYSEPSFVGIGQNVGKSLGEFRRLAAAQTLMKDHQLRLV